MSDHPNMNSPVASDATTALVFDARAWQANGGDDDNENRQFWREAQIISREPNADGDDEWAVVQFIHDQRVSHGHYVSAMRAVA